MSAVDFATARYHKARGEAAKAELLPGEFDVWAQHAEASDDFALETASAGKGGPFGAQLWLARTVDGKTEYKPVYGGQDDYNDSNAVVSKGQASAHAEAENLSVEKRQEVLDFLRENRDQGWEVVQVSSGESCPSCRSKQMLFAQELLDEDLIKPGQFHVVFKATYERTKEDADFNDEPYDTGLRALFQLAVLDNSNGLFVMNDTLQQSDVAKDLISKGKIVKTPVVHANEDELPQQIIDAIAENTAKGIPYAAVISADGKVMSEAIDTREAEEGATNDFEKTAIVQALHKAWGYQREELDIFEAWELKGARVVTNINEIGPLAYNEALWSSLQSLQVLGGSEEVDRNAREIPSLSNRDLFKLVALEYNVDESPLHVVHSGDPTVPNRAHAAWPGILQKLAEEQGINAHYDGAQAEQTDDARADHS